MQFCIELHQLFLGHWDVQHARQQIDHPQYTHTNRSGIGSLPQQRSERFTGLFHSRAGNHRSQFGIQTAAEVNDLSTVFWQDAAIWGEPLSEKHIPD